jgi:hypothetical protein
LFVGIVKTGHILLPTLGQHINKKNTKKKRKRKNTKKQLKKMKYISEKNIPEYLGNYRRLVEEDQNIQD